MSDYSAHVEAPSNPIELIWRNWFTRIPVMLALSVGTVLSIAGGFYVTYLCVTYVGN